jgi:hypothetical protein
MIMHYLTVALRNLWKYRLQSVISIVGLAVGFVCFSTAALWIRYEMTYDHFHKNAKRIYSIQTASSFQPSGYVRQSPYPLAAYLKETFPEVAGACNLRTNRWEVTVDGVKMPLKVLSVDSAFMRMFDVPIVEGHLDFSAPGNRQIALTTDKARQIFGDSTATGRTLTYNGEEYTVTALVNGWSEHSNYPFELLAPMLPVPHWNTQNSEALLELHPGANMQAFRDSMAGYTIERDGISVVINRLLPLTSLRYEDANMPREVKFQHILLYALAGTLVILCSLFNYLTLFLSRFRIRRKEFALRMVCGSSKRALFALLSAEYLVSLLPAALLGIFLMEAVFAPFQRLSGIRADKLSICLELALYAVAVTALSLLIFLLVLLPAGRNALNAAIRRSHSSLFRKISVVFQLAISIGFIFCTAVMMKQVYFLHHSDLGFSYRNTGSIDIFSEALENRIKQIPEIIETSSGEALLPMRSRSMWGIPEWEGKTPDAELINIENIKITRSWLDFFQIRPVAGELPSDDDPANYVLINESAARAFGWEDRAVGKTFRSFNGKDEQHVKGVIKDLHNFSPLTPASPCFFTIDTDDHSQWKIVLFRFAEGQWEPCKRRIEELIHEEEPSRTWIMLRNADEIFAGYLKSESALMKLLGFVSLVCVIISVFGFVSLVLLTGEERRKEIAIRKINGATVWNILGMFFREYALLLAAGAAVAFPAGYYIMKRWLEQYTKQTDISLWVYAAILLLMAAAIVLCTGWRVYRTSRENPADVLKTD